MAEETVLTKIELRKLRPSTYLSEHGGFGKGEQGLDGSLGNLTTAACLTFEDAEVAPQELSTVYEAIKQCLELGDAIDPGHKLQQAVSEAFGLTSSLLGQPVNGAIVGWLQECVPFVASAGDITAFMRLLSSLVQQYSLTMNLKYGDS